VKELRVGIAGLGEFGELYCTILSQIPYVKITRVCSRTLSRAEEIAVRYNIPGISTDYAAFAQAEDIDIACVVTLGKDHRAAVVPALEAGKHVLVEKPIADSVADAQAMADVAAKSPGKFMTAHICRFMPPYLQAKQQIEAGQIGRISTIQAHRNNHYSTLAPGRKKNPLRETAIHDIDLALWYTGSQVAEAHGYRKYNQSQAEADSCTAIVRLADGTICTFNSSWQMRDAAPAGLDAGMRIIGIEGEIEIKMPPAGYRFIDDHSQVAFNPETSLTPVILKQSALAREIEYFLECVLEDRMPQIITPEEAVKALRAAIHIDEKCVEVR
jgi:predicted dehydrogenase